MTATVTQSDIEKRFRLDRPPTIMAHTTPTSPVSFCRLRKDSFGHGLIQSPAEDAFVFHVSLVPTARVEVCVDGGHREVADARAGDLIFFDLATSSTTRLDTPFDSFRFYVPRSSLKELAIENGMLQAHNLRTSTFGNHDPILHRMAQIITTLMDRGETGPSLFIDCLALTFQAHLLNAYGDKSARAYRRRGGLAPWQLRRVTELMEADIKNEPSVAQLAYECEISVGHFARAFRQTTGIPPQRWLIRRRIERAKVLMQERNLTLAQIAVAVGFVDQSHFTRMFLRSEGLSPGEWRRRYRV